jgi:hypothetical protein
MMIFFFGEKFLGSRDVNCTNSCFTLKMFTFLASLRDADEGF